MLGSMGNSILVFDMIVIPRYTGICMLPLHGCLEEALPVFCMVLVLAARPSLPLNAVGEDERSGARAGLMCYHLLLILIFFHN